MTLDFTITIGHLITLATFYVGSLVGLVKFIAAQQEKRLTEKFGEVNKSMQAVSQNLSKETEETRVLKTEFLRFQAELPRDYVRRDDFLRAVGTIEARIDNFALRMERALDGVSKK